MKTVRIFSDRIRNRIRLERLASENPIPNECTWQRRAMSRFHEKSCQRQEEEEEGNASSIVTVMRYVIPRDENGSDTNGYHSYYICFHISVRIRIRTRIAFGYIYEYGLTRLRIRIMSIEYGMNRIRRRSDTNIYSDIE